MNPKTGVVIPSAGHGTRMGAGPAKQMLLIGNMTILEHTIRRILKIPGLGHLVIPTTSELLEVTQELATRCLDNQEKSHPVVLDVIIGGKNRMESVKKGLMQLAKSEVELVLVHDAVRPCFPMDATLQALRTAHTNGAAILAIPARDTIKKVDDLQQSVVETPDRKQLWLAQTPQVFRKELLIKAFNFVAGTDFIATDDASLLEFAGLPVRIVPGSQENIKITYPSDIFFAEQWLSPPDK